MTVPPRRPKMKHFDCWYSHLSGNHKVMSKTKQEEQSLSKEPFEISNDALSLTLILGFHVPLEIVFLHNRQLRTVDLAEREGFLFSLLKGVNLDSFLISDMCTRPITE